MPGDGAPDSDVAARLVGRTPVCGGSGVPERHGSQAPQGPSRRAVEQVPGRKQPLPPEADPIREGRRYPFVAGTLEGQDAGPRLDLSPASGSGSSPRRRSKRLSTETTGIAGLLFDGVMSKYCGQTAIVRSRVTRIINERTGTMRHFSNEAIMLEDVVCTGDYLQLVPRRIYDYWREIWLERSSSGLADGSDPQGRGMAVARRSEEADHRSIARRQEPVADTRAQRGELEAIAGLRLGPIVRCDARSERWLLRRGRRPHPRTDPGRARNRCIRDRDSALAVAVVCGLGLGDAATVFASTRPESRPRVLTNLLLALTLTSVAGALVVSRPPRRSRGCAAGGLTAPEVLLLGVGAVVTALFEAVRAFLLGCSRFRPQALVQAVWPWVYAGLLLVVSLTSGLSVVAAITCWVAASELQH